MKDDVRFAREHAWQYFQLHSQQRITVFNFYIVVIGLLAAGSGVCLQQGGHLIYLSSLLGGMIVLVTLLFYKLDQRVSYLIKNSEDALVAIEDAILEPQQRVFKRDSTFQNLNSGLFHMWSYGRCFRLAFYIVGNIGVVIALTPLIINFAKLRGIIIV